MIVLGLTGLICSGKTTVSLMFQRFGISVFNADEIVHSLYKSELFLYIKSIFPEVISDGVVNRKLLGELFLAKDSRWGAFESKVQRVVLKYMIQFINSERRRNKRFVLVDVPLLIEARMDQYCDIIIVVRVNNRIRRLRAGKRNVSDRIFSLMISRQMNDIKKCEMADFVINNSLSVWHTFAQVNSIISSLKGSGR